MPDHMLALWRSGRCPFLVPASFWESPDRLRIRLDAEGLVQVASYAAVCPDGLEDGFCLLLTSLASAARAFASLQQWLADPAYISLDPSLLFFDRDKGSSLLMFSDSPDNRPFLARFSDLCRGLGPSGALIAERLEEAGRSVRMEEQGTARFLEKWLLQILA